MKPLTVLLIALWICTSCGSGGRPASKSTRLQKAAQKGDIKAVKALLAAGAEVNAKTKKGSWTPLHYAAWFGHTEVVKLLLEAGAKVNARDNYGKTPLCRAARLHRNEAAKLLIEAGADVNIRDRAGDTPLDKAQREQTRQLLRKHGAKTGAELDAEAKQGKQ